MNMHEFLILYLCLLATMLLCRCVPLFVLKGRALSPRMRKALGLIPPAAFAALVANDLFQPQVLAENPITGLRPLIAALPVVVVAKKTESLILSAVTGMAAYAALVYIPALLS